MTTDVRLLSTYKGFPPQSIISLPDAEATSLVAVSHASLTLTGGTRRYITVANRDTAAQKLPLGLHTVAQNQQMAVLVPEGQYVVLTGDASAAATVTRNGTADTWVIGANAVRTIGPYLNQQVLTVQCTAGTVTAENHDSGAAAGLAQAVAAIKPRPLPLMSFGTRAVATGLSGINWRRTVEAPAGFDFARVGFENASLNPQTVNGSLAATSSLVDPATLDGTVVPLTFNAAATGTVPAAATGREYNASRTADNGLACVPNTYYSDWVPIADIARTDGGVNPALGVSFRIVEAVAGSVTRAVIEGAATFNAPGTTRKEYTYTKTGGDATASGSGTGWVATAAGGQLFPAVWIETMSRNLGDVVMGSGDSTVYGVGGTSGTTGCNGWVNRGANLASRPDYPVVCVNASWPGSAHKHWTATDIPGGTSLTVAGNTGVSQFEHNLQTFRPTDVVILTWSTNDAASPATPTAAEFRLAFGRAMYMAKLASDYGARVIFCTPFPRESLTPTGVTNHTAATEFVRSQLAGPNLFDVFALIGDAVTRGYASGMGADSSHPSEAGYALLGYEFAKFLRSRQRR